MKRFALILPVVLLTGWSSFGQVMTVLDGAFVGSLNQPAASGPSNTLLVHYTFNEGTGTTLNDETANNYDATLSGATWVTGASGSGGALQFDGTDDYARSDGNITYGTNTISVSYWLWWDTYASNYKTSLETSDNPNTYKPAYYFIPNDNSNKFEVGLRDSTGAHDEEFTRASEDAWHHYVFVLDRRTSTHVFTIYVDGSAVSTTKATETSSGTDNLLAARLSIMRRAEGSLYGAGRMDDLRIYSGVLTQTDVDYLYANPQ